MPLALLNAGNSSAARIAMIAMTTSSSMSVKAQMDGGKFFTEGNEGGDEVNGDSFRGARLYAASPSDRPRVLLSSASAFFIALLPSTLKRPEGRAPAPRTLVPAFGGFVQMHPNR